MRNIFRWTALIWLPASIVFAQAPGEGEPLVKVVFAPDYRQEASKPGNAVPVTFAAPGGAIGIRLGQDFMVGTVVTIGDDGKPAFQCGRLHEALKKTKPANSAAQPARKDTAYAKQ